MARAAGGAPDDALELRPILPAPRRHYHTHQVFPKVFTAKQCERIVSMVEALEVSDGQLVGLDGDLHDAQYRQSRLSWLGFDDSTAWIFERLRAVAARANAQWQLELTGFTEDLQVTRYDEAGSFYTWHQDGLDGDVATRKLSMVVQLSDPATYDGCELELLEVAEDYDDEQRAAWQRRARARGTVVAFPAFEYHRVTPLVRGTRLSLVCWIGGPPFR
jgi:PKHD-type hydroxylase